MRDSDIRQVLKLKLQEQHAQEPDTLILDELGLCRGESRVDMAVVNGLISGYEIKSDRDTLDRLPAQAAVYEKTLDRVALVVGPRHLDHARDLLPDFWGIIIATSKNGKVVLSVEREAKPTPERDGAAIAQLLWKSEAVALLKRCGVSKGLTTKTRLALCQLLANQMSVDELSAEVRSILKSRTDWRVRPLISPTPVNRSRSRENSLVRSIAK